MRELIDDIRPTQYNGFCQNCAEKDQRIKELEKLKEKLIEALSEYRIICKKERENENRNKI